MRKEEEEEEEEEGKYNWHFSNTQNCQGIKLMNKVHGVSNIKLPFLHLAGK